MCCLGQNSVEGCWVNSSYVISRNEAEKSTAVAAALDIRE